MEEQRKWFLKMESIPVEDAVEIVEMTIQDLEYYINIIDEASTGFERTDSNFDRNSTMGNILSNNTTCYREIIQERKS